MINFQTLFGVVLLFGALLIPGYLMGKCGRIEDSALNGITNILTDVALPFLVFVKLVETDLSEIAPLDATFGLLLPIGHILLMYVLSKFFYLKEDLSGRACSIFTNCGFLSLPLAVAVFMDHPAVVVFVSLFNLVHSFLILTLGVYLFTGNTGNIRFKTVLIKPVTIAILAGAVGSVLHVGTFFPCVITYSNYLALLCTPLSMFVVGVKLARIPLRSVFASKAVYHTGFLKLIFAPLLMMLMLFLLQKLIGIPLSKELAVGMVLSVSASSGTIVSAIAHSTGKDAERATAQILATTVFCILTLPLMSAVFEWIF